MGGYVVSEARSRGRGGRRKDRLQVDRNLFDACSYLDRERK
jgi:hypothetical protein